MKDAGRVLTGLDVLAGEGFRRLAGRRVGVVCNHTALDRRGRHIADLLKAHAAGAAGAKLVALFAPEHGVRGDVDASVGDSRDARTGVPVHSLYDLRQPKERRYRPTPAQLSGVDTLVFDIQDIGARFYTYIATLGYVLEAAAPRRIRVVVLDRPNPLGGETIDGPTLDPALAGSFTGYHTMPVTHGMTVGELARLFNAERRIGAEVEVVAMRGWKRSFWWDATGLPWVNPSPNMRSARQAALYPGVGMLEGLPLSVGRGTDTPFEVLGAPWVDGLALADALNARRLPGVSFVPVRFTPSSSKHRGLVCGGVQIFLWDRAACRPCALGVHVADALVRLFPRALPPDVLLKGMSDLAGGPRLPTALAARTPPGGIVAEWERDLHAWRRRRAPFLLYA